MWQAWLKDFYLLCYSVTYVCTKSTERLQIIWETDTPGWGQSSRRKSAHPCRAAKRALRLFLSLMFAFCHIHVPSVPFCSHLFHFAPWTHCSFILLPGPIACWAPTRSSPNLTEIVLRGSSVVVILNCSGLLQSSSLLPLYMNSIVVSSCCNTSRSNSPSSCLEWLL
jgi:hypothetical protein